VHAVIYFRFVITHAAARDMPPRGVFTELHTLWHDDEPIVAGILSSLVTWRNASHRNGESGQSASEAAV
jgi:hypothetical protein